MVEPTWSIIHGDCLLSVQHTLGGRRYGDGTIFCDKETKCHVVHGNSRALPVARAAEKHQDIWRLRRCRAQLCVRIPTVSSGISVTDTRQCIQWHDRHCGIELYIKGIALSLPLKRTLSLFDPSRRAPRWLRLSPPPSALVVILGLPSASVGPISLSITSTTSWILPARRPADDTPSLLSRSTLCPGCPPWTLLCSGEPLDKPLSDDLSDGNALSLLCCVPHPSSLYPVTWVVDSSAHLAWLVLNPSSGGSYGESIICWPCCTRSGSLAAVASPIRYAPTAVPLTCLSRTVSRPNMSNPSVCCALPSVRVQSSVGGLGEDPCVQIMDIEESTNR